MKYILDAVIGRCVITEERARADWDSWAEHLREGEFGGRFRLYAESEFGCPFAPNTYTPVEGPGE